MNWDKILIQIATADVLQIATSLLQITVGATNCNRFITDCNSYYKLWLILQLQIVIDITNSGRTPGWVLQTLAFKILNG